ncbi:Nucleotide-binding, alpha-beta plait [Artemisia annua]|uniref:Nucleotide-binding, alpha-beta plait n=1 Tax=Artemisia annua TaxID=35608 RepID=A0A2U1NUD2_ARTAN|nr:Nucleotide-binding, alpha-beta plait [Artemisia annua]
MGLWKRWKWILGSCLFVRYHGVRMRHRLKEYFSSYSGVVEALIMRDRITGRARGFDFVVFVDPAVAERVVLDTHMIDGRTFIHGVLGCAFTGCLALDGTFERRNLNRKLINVSTGRKPS